LNFKPSLPSLELKYKQHFEKCRYVMGNGMHDCPIHLVFLCIRKNKCFHFFLFDWQINWSSYTFSENVLRLRRYLSSVAHTATCSAAAAALHGVAMVHYFRRQSVAFVRAAATWTLVLLPLALEVTLGGRSHSRNIASWAGTGPVFARTLPALQWANFTNRTNIYQKSNNKLHFDVF
jgi:hypothetical protein